MLKKSLVTTCLSVLIPGFILFHCNIPEPPPDSEDAKVTLLFKSSDGKIDGTGSIQDSIGKEVQIGIVLYLTQYIDSSVVRVILDKDTVRTFPWAFKKNTVDTVFFSITFTKTGTHKVEVTSYIKDQPNAVDEGKIIIYGLSTTKVNRAPQWNPGSMQRTVKPGTQFSYDLSSICSDPDSEVVTFSLIPAPPAKDTIVGRVYSFTPTAADSGKYTAHILAKDSSGLTDTLVLVLTVSAIEIPDRVPPVITFQSPSKDTVISTDSFDIKVTCVDDSGCTVKCFRDGTAFNLEKSLSVSNLWTGITKGIAAGSYSTIKIVATDSSAAKNKDSASIKIKYDNDKSGPEITLLIPAKDSVTTNTSSYTIVLKITDPSGVLAVNGISGGTNYTGVKDTGSTWKINVNNLENNKTTVVVLSATDSSLKANKTIDSVYIRSEIVNGYTIKFDKNDNAATGTMADLTINSGDSAKLSANAFVKDGSTFGGWMTNPTGTTIAYADGAMFKMGTSNVILYAKWIKKATFVLTITATNGSVTKSPDAAVYDSGSTVGFKATATTGYKFMNWTGDATGTSDSMTIIVNKAIHITANFSPVPYTVTYNSQGITYSTATVNYNALVTEPAAPQGGACDTFGGWYTSGTYVTKWNFLTDKVTSDTTLIAKWTKRTYIVTYNSNGAASGTPPVQQTKTCDVALTLAANSGSLSKTGVTFFGWNTATDGTGTDYPQSASYTANAPLSLFAKWKPVFTVTYNANGGTGAVPVDNNKYESGQLVTVLGAGSLNRTNYTFAGWNAQADTLGTNYGETFPMSNANVTLYAKWRMNAPVITTHPAYKTCPVNDSVTFTVVATGAGLSYQWQKNNGDIGGATSASYTPPALTVADTAGPVTYRCVVSNAGGSIPSNGATLAVSTLSDADGNVYHQVKIGTQIWTMENLRVTKYTDRTPIPWDTSNATWSERTPKYCYYNNTTNADSINKYGALYNWYVVSPTNTSKIAPAGWHMPSDAEWDILQNYLIANGYNWDNTTTGNKIAKSMAAKTDWNATSIEGAPGKDLIINNSSGFTAFGVGNRRSAGDFCCKGGYAFWWSSSEDDALYAWDRYLYWEYASLEKYSDSKSCGFSVRLLKD